MLMVVSNESFTRGRNFWRKILMPTSKTDLCCYQALDTRALEQMLCKLIVAFSPAKLTKKSLCVHIRDWNSYVFVLVSGIFAAHIFCSLYCLWLRHMQSVYTVANVLVKFYQRLQTNAKLFHCGSCGSSPCRRSSFYSSGIFCLCAAHLLKHHKAKQQF